MVTANPIKSSSNSKKKKNRIFPEREVESEVDDIYAPQKRYQKTKTGKILRRKAYRGHILEKKSQKRKRNLRQKGLVSNGELTPIRLMLPN